MQRGKFFVLALIYCLSAYSPVSAQAVEPDRVSPSTQASINSACGKLPLRFEINQGQADSQVRFLSRGIGYGMFLSPAETVMVLNDRRLDKDLVSPASDRSSVIRMSLAGANPLPEMTGEDVLPGRSNYLIGNDSEQWLTGVSSYGRVRYKEVYPGIDLVYYGNQRQMEYDFIVSPGADPQKIRMIFKGTDTISLDSEGNLVLHTDAGSAIQHAPILYQTQTADGRLVTGKDKDQSSSASSLRSPVSGRYILLADNQVGFEVDNYDPSKPLVIDPVLSLGFSSYLGGESYDFGQAIALDPSGNIYVAGWTSSTRFPTKNPNQAVYKGGNTDVFVARLNAEGSALIYSTYLGGSGTDIAYGIAVDSGGNAYVTGFTGSTNFPALNAFQSAIGSAGFDDAFVAKLSGDGRVVYATYLGGGQNDWGYGIAVDSSGNAYVTGNTASIRFPTVNGLQLANGGGYDAFVAKLDSGGSVAWSTYLGGRGFDQGSGIAVDSSGNVYVTGKTQSADFPTAKALQPVSGGDFDAFVVKLNTAGSALVYSTYLGGGGADEGAGIALDLSGNAYVTGNTTSHNFPTANALQSANAGGYDAFVAELNSAGSALVYSTYLGGGGYDQGSGIAVDFSGNAYVAGYTASADFPTSNALQAANGGGNDAFAAKLNSSGSELVWSTYLGSGNMEYGQAIAVDFSGNSYVAGFTSSTGFPLKAAFQTAYGGGGDAYVTKIIFASPTSTTTTTSATLTCTSGTLYTATLPNGSTGNVCLSMKKVTTPSGEAKLRGTASASWSGFATAANAKGSMFTFAWENYESDSSTGILYENNPAQGALFILAYAFPGDSCSAGASFFAVVEALNAVSLTNLGSSITVTPLFGQICGTSITTLSVYTLTK